MDVKIMLRFKEGVGPHYMGRGRKLTAGDMVEESEVGKGARDKFDEVEVSANAPSVEEHPSARLVVGKKHRTTAKKKTAASAKGKVVQRTRTKPPKGTPRFVVKPRKGKDGLFDVVSTATGEALNVDGLTEDKAKELLDEEHE